MVPCFFQFTTVIGKLSDFYSRMRIHINKINSWLYECLNIRRNVKIYAEVYIVRTFIYIN